jgi:hypothetical protein
LAHFVNNTMGVLSYYFVNRGVISRDIDEFGTGTDQLPLVILSFSIVSLLLFLIYRSELEKNKNAHESE